MTQARSLAASIAPVVGLDPVTILAVLTALIQFASTLPCVNHPEEVIANEAEHRPDAFDRHVRRACHRAGVPLEKWQTVADELRPRCSDQQRVREVWNEIRLAEGDTAEWVP